MPTQGPIPDNSSGITHPRCSKETAVLRGWSRSRDLLHKMLSIQNAPHVAKRAPVPPISTLVSKLLLSKRSLTLHFMNAVTSSLKTKGSTSSAMMTSKRPYTRKVSSKLLKLPQCQSLSSSPCLCQTSTSLHRAPSQTAFKNLRFLRREKG